MQTMFQEAGERPAANGSPGGWSVFALKERRPAENRAE